MKATIELEDALYRRLKVEAASRGRKVKELVAEGVRRVLDEPTPVASDVTARPDSPPDWFGTLRKYAANADGRHDLVAIRNSIVRGRARHGS